MNNRDWSYFIHTELEENYDSLFKPDNLVLDKIYEEKGEIKSWREKLFLLIVIVIEVLDNLKLKLREKINPKRKSKEKSQRIPGELTGIRSEVNYGENKSR